MLSKKEMSEPKGKLEPLHEWLKDLRRWGELQNETALLAMKIMPWAERPPENSTSDRLGPNQK